MLKTVKPLRLSKINKYFKIVIGILMINILFHCTSNRLTVQSNIEKSEIITFGRTLFYDKNLSWNKKLSCASCHDPNLAFTDGYRKALNGDADVLKRNTPSLLNTNSYTFLNWADTSISDYRKQLNRPLYSEHPIEMGWKGRENEILQRVRQNPFYGSLYQEAYHHLVKNITIQEIKESLTMFVSNLNQRNSRYDQWIQNKKLNDLTESELIGYRLFTSDSLGCLDCHGGVDFNQARNGNNLANTGLYNCQDSYPLQDRGLQDLNQNPKDNGRFRIPSLRNVAITSPYYHDGSANTLEEVILNYERRGRLFVKGECVGDGSKHPMLDSRLKTFTLSSTSRKSLIAFLGTLTDTSYTSQNRYTQPLQE